MPVLLVVELEFAFEIERRKPLHRGETKQCARVFPLVQDPAEHQLIDVRDFIETGIDQILGQFHHLLFLVKVL